MAECISQNWNVNCVTQYEDAKQAEFPRRSAGDVQASVIASLDYSVVGGSLGWAESAARSLRENGFCIVRSSDDTKLAPLQICDRCAEAAVAQLKEFEYLCQKVGIDFQKEKVMFSELCARSPGCLRYDLAVPMASEKQANTPDKCRDWDAWTELHSCIDKWARPVLEVFGLFRRNCPEYGTPGDEESGGCDRAGCVISLPGSPHQSVHRDSTGFTAGSSGLVTVFMALVQVNALNGPTEFHPGTHKQSKEDFILDFAVSDLEDEDVLPVQPTLNKGDMLFFDYDVYHRGLANSSSDPRPLAYIVYNRPGVTDKHNFPNVSLRASACMA